MTATSHSPLQQWAVAGWLLAVLCYDTLSATPYNLSHPQPKIGNLPRGAPARTTACPSQQATAAYTIYVRITFTLPLTPQNIDLPNNSAILTTSCMGLLGL